MEESEIKNISIAKWKDLFVDALKSCPNNKYRMEASKVASDQKETFKIDIKDLRELKDGILVGKLFDVLQDAAYELCLIENLYSQKPKLQVFYEGKEIEILQRVQTNELSLTEGTFYCPLCKGITGAYSCPNLEALRTHFENYLADHEHSKWNPFCPYSIEDLCETLDSTVKKDRTSKVIAFLDMLLAQSEEDQFNIMFRARSASGKSYIPLELAQYFPEMEVIIYSGASPTSFFHEKGMFVVEVENERGEVEYKELSQFSDPIQQQLQVLQLKEKKSQEDKERISELKKELRELYGKAKILVDAEKKIFIFVDQPNIQLLAKLRSFLSHDSKCIEVVITDATSRGSHRAKHVILMGYAAVIFCTVSHDYSEQEANRNFILSPESEQGKILEALKLLDGKLSDRERFRDMLKADPKRGALIYRIRVIRASGINRIRTDPGVVLERFLKLHKEAVENRATRDFTRLYSLIYGHALLNCFQRERQGNTIKATVEDIDAGFQIYEPIMKSNELGLSPETFSLYNNIVVKAYLAKNENNPNIWTGLSYSEICKAYREREKRILGYDEVKQTMKSLNLAGLITEDQDENDRRKVLFSPILADEEVQRAKDKAKAAESTKRESVQGAFPYSFQS